MPQIRPIAELRNTSKISELCHKQSEPVFITKNGYGDLVIMSMETYEKHLALVDVYKKLGEAEKQIADGVPPLEGEQVFKRLREKYAKQL
ncbi:MAG: type II toxin-antitoxin system Phd/YefM family antitoxin [Bacillota bacterium]